MPFSFQASEQRLGDELSRNACRNDFVVGLRFPITACGSKIPDRQKVEPQEPPLKQTNLITQRLSALLVAGA